MRTLARSLMRNFVHRWSGDAPILVVLRYYSTASGYDPSTGKTINVYDDTLPLKVIPLAVTDEDKIRYSIQTSSQKLVIPGIDLGKIPDVTTRVVYDGGEYIIEKVIRSSFDANVTVFVKGL